MLRAVMTMEATVFSEQPWMEDPWAGIQKGYEQRIYDKGFALAGLSGKVKDLKIHPSKEGVYTVLALGTEIMRSISVLDQEDMLTADDLRQLSSIETLVTNSQNGRLELLKLKLTLWAIQLGTAQILHATCQTLDTHIHTIPMAPGLSTLYEESKAWANLDRNDALSRQIINAVQIVQTHDDSLFAGSRLLCPIMVVMAQWKDRPGPELKQCCESRGQLTDRRGMGFGKTLTRFGSNVK